MTDAQYLALTRLHFGNVRVVKMTFGFNTHPESDKNDVLQVSYYDMGGNFHQVGYTPDGTLRTYG